MSDIVERLRQADIGWSGDAACVDADTAEEGAREIERLRLALDKICNDNKWRGGCYPTMHACQVIAREALGAPPDRTP